MCCRRGIADIHWALMRDERGVAAVGGGEAGLPGEPASLATLTTVPVRSEEGFGELLRRYRSARGISQAGLATRAGMDRSYVNRIEAGERGAPAEPGTDALARGLELTDGEADRLFVAAGLLPRSLRTLGAADPTIVLLAQRLTDVRLTPASRAALRATVETIVRCWSNPVTPVSTVPDTA